MPCAPGVDAVPHGRTGSLIARARTALSGSSLR